MKFSVLVILFIIFNYINAKSIKSQIKSNKEKNNDQHYLIFVNNVYGEIPIFSNNNSKLRKRQESTELVESLVGKIHNIIVNNKDTYQHPEVLKEIEESNSKLKKRDNEDNWNSTIVYPISSIDNTTVLLAYLSNDLVEEVESLNHIKKCVPNFKMNSSENYYNMDDIKKETNWESVTVQKDAVNHLSLLSQGKYNPKIIHRYDNNYYYPSSAGKDIDIIILDTNFNFDYSEFSNTDDRKVKCIGHTKDGKVNTDVSRKHCGHNYHTYYSNHGEKVSDVAGGLVYGSAKRANIYGISHEYDKETGQFDVYDSIAEFQYVYENLLRPHKTVINCSSGYFDNLVEGGDSSWVTDHYHTILRKISDKGGIIVSSAGNDGIALVDGVRFIPCSFESVICIGGLTEDLYKYDIDPQSNYGGNVNFYNSYYTELAYLDRDEVLIENISGTSFSSPLTAGVIATIMSENKDTKFTTESMIEHLNKTGLNEISKKKDRMPYIRINNGKHIVYSKDDLYFGCGITAGNRPCSSTTTTTTTTTTTIRKGIPTSTVSGRCGPEYGACPDSNYCCSKYGYCGTSDKHCNSGCQSEFGKCNTTWTKSTTKTSSTKTTTKTTTSKKTTPTKKSSTTTKKTTKKSGASSTKKKTTTTRTRFPTSTVVGRCGPEYGACSNSGHCCSKYGYCGTSWEYCNSGCQSSYGICK